MHVLLVISNSHCLIILYTSTAYYSRYMVMIYHYYTCTKKKIKVLGYSNYICMPVETPLRLLYTFLACMVLLPSISIIEITQQYFQ